MSPSEVCRSLWGAMEQRNWNAVSDILALTLVAVWPMKGEYFDRENYIAANRDYPGDWHIHVELRRWGVVEHALSPSCS